MESPEAQFEAFRDRFERLSAEVGKVFIGQPLLVERTLICLICRGHLLIEGLPGLGKTLLAKTLGQALDLRFSWIQCTPDLMPADIVGTNLLVEDAAGRQHVRFHPGPIFANLVLVDEINRATPKTQSAFLEAMQEGRVTAVGVTRDLDPTFFVIATQNPIEHEGTYPLPEAQLDRFFFKLEVGMPGLEDLARIIDLTTGPDRPAVAAVCSGDEIASMAALARTVKIADRVKRYALRLVRATHADASEAPEAVKSYVRYGASPRAAQSMILAAKVRAITRGRYHVAEEDLRDVAAPALIHRLILNFEGDVARVTTHDVVRELLAGVEP